MSNNNQEKAQEDGKSTWLGKFISDITDLKMPASLEKNLIRSASRLLIGAVDVPAAWLNERKRRIQRETEALDHISKESAKAIAAMNIKDPNFIRETADYYDLRQFKKQINRQAILTDTIKDIQASHLIEETDEIIDEDWLDVFSNLAEKKSNRDVQLILSKILSGEIRKPGSFSLTTMDVLARMDKKTAEAFVQACEVSCESVSTRLHYASDIIFFNFNRPLKQRTRPDELIESIPSLPVLGIDLLKEVGLIRHESHGLKQMWNLRFTHDHKIGSTAIRFKEGANTVKASFRIIEFTNAGAELKKVLNYGSDWDYIEAYVKHVIEKTGLEIDYVGDKKTSTE